MDVLTSDGHRLHRELHEPADPWAQLLLVHGLGEHVGRWRLPAQSLAARGLRVSAFDLRGHGRSSGPRGHARFASLRDDLRLHLNLLGEECPELPVFLYGHSLGGGLALDYLLRGEPAPAGAVVTAPALRPAFDPPAWQLAIARIAVRILPRITFRNTLDLSGLASDPEVERRYRDDPLVHDRVSAGLAIDALEAGERALRLAARLALPVQLHHGTEDRLTSIEATRSFARDAGPNAELIEWPGRLHELHNEPIAEQLFEHVDRWLSARLRS